MHDTYSLVSQKINIPLAVGFPLIFYWDVEFRPRQVIISHVDACLANS
jgi:hypothetical protein